MAFINVEARGTHYRVITGMHGFPTPARRLPEQCTAIVVEGGVNKEQTLYDALIGLERIRQIAYRVQYSELREQARQQGLPIVGGEPLVRMGAGEMMSNELFPYGFLGFLASIYLALIDREISPDAGIVKLVEASTKEYESRRVNANPITLKNQLIAQTAETFAEIQRTRGQDPYVTVVIGSGHVGIVHELKKDLDMRVRDIKTDPRLKRYYEERTLSKGHYVKYDIRQSRWTRRSFEDIMLRKVR